jgi:N-methylhydantoinase A/oxoprolinase/acetone carboxylase beta subunit
MAKPPLSRPEPADPDAPTRKGERQAYFPETGFVATPVFDRELLEANTRLEGPALLEEPESTIVLPPGNAMTLDDHGNLLIEAVRAG